MQDDKLKAHTAEPHSLLNTSSGLTMPTEQEIEAADAPEEIHKILERIEQVRSLHSDNLDVYRKARELDELAIRKFYILSVSEPNQETENASK